MPDKNKLYIIKVLLLLLYYKDFTYYIRVSKEEDKNNKIIT